MARTLTVLVLGVLLGAAAMLLLRPSSPLPDLGTLPPLAVPAAPPTEPVVSAAAREGGADFYRQLAGAGASELAAMIGQAATEPQSTDRELALALLLKRYSELDPLGAVRLAREARASGTGLAVAYGAWARRAPAQALAALGTVENPEAAAEVALALIGALGNDAAAVGRVAAVLATRADEEPFAISTAQLPSPAGPALRSGTRSALVLTAERWAALDPRRAMAVARSLDDARVRLALEAAALRALARTAPDEAFAHIAPLGEDAARIDAHGGTFVELARADPERLLAATAGWPPESRRLAEASAVQQLAERDPAAALRYLERLPMTGERQGLLQTVARSYGKRDAAAALAWARSQPGRETLVAAVLGGLAEQDPIRALDLALELTSPNERRRAAQIVAVMGLRQQGSPEAIATRLLAIDDLQLREMTMIGVVSAWAARSPDAAMSWLLSDGLSASPNVFMQFGQQIARLDPHRAIDYLGRVPATARAQWAQGVVQGYAQSDPQGAFDWLGQFRGEEWYETAVGTLAWTVAQRDGAAAARLVDGLDPTRNSPQASQLSATVAAQWANQDPAAAAEWALDRPNEPERTSAVGQVLGVWSQQNVDEARRWALRLPPGSTRDRALTTVLTAAARTARGIDSVVLNAFASEGTRQQAVLQVVQTLAQNDRAQAQSIADAHLTDPALRERARRMLDTPRNSPPLVLNTGPSEATVVYPPPTRAR